MVFGITQILLVLALIASGPPPSNAAMYLQALTASRTPYLIRSALFYLVDILILPVTLAIFFVLKGVNRSRALLASALLLLGAAVDLAAGFNTSLPSLADGYAAATTDAQRAAFLAAAQSAIATGNATGLLVILLISIGVVMIGSVMLKSIFTKRVAYLGLATGIVGIIWSAGSSFSSIIEILILVYFLLLAIWLFAIGARLYRLSG